MVLGIVTGWLFTKLVRVGAALLAAWGGITLGVLLNGVWLYRYGSFVLFWIVNIVLGIACAIPAYIFFNEGIMLSTALIGSFFLARGISTFTGGFPPVVLMIELAKLTGHQFLQLDRLFWVYIGGIVVSTIIGFLWQYCLYKKCAKSKPNEP